MPSIPAVLKAMTPFPYSIEPDDTLVTARMMMDEHDIHHLPVTRGGRLIGLLSESDIRAAGSLMDERDARQLRVRHVCTMPPFVVDADDRLDDVVLAMAERRYSTAIVTRRGKLVGIVTETDVCRYLGRVLRDQAGYRTPAPA